MYRRSRRGGLWRSHKLLVLVKDTKAKGQKGVSKKHAPQGPIPCHLSGGDIHFTCVYMNVRVVSQVCALEGCKEVSASLNPFLQRNTC